MLVQSGRVGAASRAIVRRESSESPIGCAFSARGRHTDRWVIPQATEPSKAVCVCCWDRGGRRVGIREHVARDVIQFALRGEHHD
jgi:hypothetical protein